MARFGMDEALQELFMGTGLSSLYGMSELTYRDSTLEFFSSFRFISDDRLCKFRLRGNSFEMTIDELSAQFDFSTPYYSERLCYADEIWRAITGTPISEFDVSHMRISFVHDPRLKIFLRTLGITIFGRDSIERANKNELDILGAFLDIDRLGPSIGDIPMFVSQHFIKITLRKQMKTIACGGLIIFLARQLADFDPADGLPPLTSTVPLMDESYLIKTSHWVKKEKDNSFKWKVTSSRLLPIPLSWLPKLSSYSTYLLSPDIVGPQGNARAALDASHPSFEAGSSSSSFSHVNYAGFYPNSFENLRHNFEMVDRNILAYYQYAKLLASNIAPKDGPHPSYWTTDPRAFRNNVFSQYNFDPTAWGPDYHATFGGAGGHLLPPSVPVTRGGSKPSRFTRGRGRRDTSGRGSSGAGADSSHPILGDGNDDDEDDG